MLDAAPMADSIKLRQRSRRTRNVARHLSDRSSEARVRAMLRVMRSRELCRDAEALRPL